MTNSGLPAKVSLMPAERIDRAIYALRGQKVILDRDLANLYRVETRAINQAVRRNIERFPEDFMFALTRPEIRSLAKMTGEKGLSRVPNVFDAMRELMDDSTPLKPAHGREIGFHAIATYSDKQRKRKSKKNLS
jgi:hypothetical protein